MYLKGKRMAVAGLSLALAVVLIVLSGIIETNTLFLLAAASFFVGIIIREFDLRMGVAFYIGAIVLGLLLAPNKLYCITFAAMGFYVLMVEVSWVMLGRTSRIQNRKAAFWILKYLVFNVMYLPMLIFFPKLLFAGEIHKGILLAFIAGGQVVLFIFDRAYEYFQVQVWNKFRKRLGL
jgi:hypothetical protein